MTYDEADKAIKAINRYNLRAFTQLKSKLMKADELHIIREVTSVYDGSIETVEAWFLEVAQKAYLQAMKDAGEEPKRTPLDRDWLIEFLLLTDPVLLFSFLNEAERKKARLIEALAATRDRAAEIDKALRLWTRQIGWGAISVVDEATMEAFRDADILKVMWISKHDARVCDVCWERNNVIYTIDNVPPKAHPACRCKLRPVK